MQFNSKKFQVQVRPGLPSSIGQAIDFGSGYPGFDYTERSWCCSLLFQSRLPNRLSQGGFVFVIFSCLKIYNFYPDLYFYGYSNGVESCGDQQHSFTRTFITRKRLTFSFWKSFKMDNQYNNLRLAQLAVERLASSKQTSSLRTIVNCGRKKFCNIALASIMLRWVC